MQMVQSQFEIGHISKSVGLAFANSGDSILIS